MTITTRTPREGRTDEKWLPLGAAAVVAGVSRPTLASAVDRGELPGKRIGVQRRVRRADVEAYVSRSGRKPSRQGLGALVNETIAGLADGYAVGGYRAISARHRGYRLAATNRTVWATERQFGDIVRRARTKDILRDVAGDPVAILRFRGGESVRLVPWPISLGRLVTERGGSRILTPDRLLVSFALEQALRSLNDTADLESLTVLALRPGTDLAGALVLLDRASRATTRFALPLGAGPASIVELPLCEAAGKARDLIASVLRRVADAGPTAAPRHRGETRPLGRSQWRHLVHDALPAPIERDRILSLLASA